MADSGGPMPNMRKPSRLKVLEGTERKDRANEAEPEYQPTEGLEPPPHLRDAEAVAAWDEWIALLEDQRVMTKADRRALAQLCNMESKSIAKWAAGDAPTAAEITQLRMLYQEFGLTPASRPKVSRLEGGESKNPFSELAG